MNLTEEIKKSETKYLVELESFFDQKWGETKLWSHDLSHHRRVWKYAKELLQNVAPEEINRDHLFVEKLLIACYLHDIGMAVDTGDRHGQHSRRLCEQFLNENSRDMSDYQDILEAIDNHDNKEYSDSPVNNKLLILLSAADDLDAFGYTGIYRYIEIYLARGIHPGKLGQMARENAEKRFNNFSLNFTRYPELVRKHKARYMLLDEFFKGFCTEPDNN